MFATKKDIESWCKEFLIKNDSGQFLCPFEMSLTEIVATQALCLLPLRDFLRK